MKKCVLLILLLSLLPGIWGCGQQSEEIQKPVHFYYLADLTAEDHFDQVIVKEIAESAGLTEEELLNRYLSGPAAENTVNPFPNGLSVAYLRKQESKIVLILSPELLELSGLDLTLACACLATTIFELYSCQSLEIIVNGHLIEGKPSIVIAREDLVLYDGGYPSESG